jgi:hypothetical protein
MKSVKKICAVALVLFAMSCKKDDDPVPVIYAEENPLNAFLAASGYNQVQVSKINNSITYETGFSFKPTVKGNINSIYVLIPAPNASLRVTIWESVTKTVLRTEILNVASANVPVTKTIAPLELTKDKEYVITMNTDDFYLREKTNGQAAVYPFQVGKILVTDYRERIGTAQVFPEGTQPDYYYGNCSFVFQQTE